MSLDYIIDYVIATGLNNDVVNGFAITLSWFFSFSVITAVLLILFIAKRDKSFIVCSAGLAATYGLTYLIKFIILRPRPSLITAHLAFGPSFPSAHAAMAFFLAGFVTGLNKKYAALFYIIAVLVSASRVLLRLHWLSDILAGALLGYLMSKAFLVLLKKFRFPLTHQ